MKETLGFSTTAKVIPVIIGASGILTMAFVAYTLQRSMLPMLEVSGNKEINFTFTMQLIGLAVSFLALTLIYLFNAESFRIFFRIKANRNASSEHQSDWSFLGPTLAVAFTVGTTMYMSFGVMAQHGVINETFFKLVPLVLLFAATNAWTEEILSRFVIVSGLHDQLKPVTICWISAIIFGMPHFFGTPSGVFGAIMAGLLGWVLAKSVLETRSLGWASFIHFLQDVVIFGGAAMIISAKDYSH
jgi:membrane protease YdiL (CAAX protease family)